MSELNSGKLGYYTALNYRTILKEADNGFHLIIPELGLYASGKDLAEAHKDLKTKKDDYFASLLKAGLEDDIPLPSCTVRNHTFAKEIKLHLLKLAITVCVLLVLGAVIAGSSRKMVSTAKTKLESAVNPDQRVSEVRLKKYKELLNRLQPFLTATREAFEQAPKKPAK